MDLQETIKAILDKDCWESNHRRCDEHTILTAKAETPYEFSGGHNLCWLCHKNDDLARELANALEPIGVPQK